MICKGDISKVNGSSICLANKLRRSVGSKRCSATALLGPHHVNLLLATFFVVLHAFKLQFCVTEHKLLLVHLKRSPLQQMQYQSDLRGRASRRSLLMSLKNCSDRRVFRFLVNCGKTHSFLMIELLLRAVRAW